MVTVSIMVELGIMAFSGKVFVREGFSRGYPHGDCVWIRTHYDSLKPQSHQAYDQVTTYLRPKNGSIVERTYDWSQRSYDWSQRSRVIARGKSLAARS